MERELRLALFNKEKAELFLSNLEKLRSDNAVNEGSYNSLKSEYSAALQHAVLRIEHLKSEFSKKIAGKKRELDVYKQELANMEARFKVGQIQAASFLRMSKLPEKKIAALENEISHLTSLVNAKHSAEVTIPQSTGIGSLFGLRPARPQQPAIVAPNIISQEPPAQTAPPPAPAPSSPEPVVEPVKVWDGTSISSLMILPDKAVTGSTIGVIATIVNTGQVPLVHRAEFKINDRVESFSDININPGQSEEVTFMTVAGAPGEYRLSVDSAQGILWVLPPPY